jgi:tetratricopeptide (TPR) repeat protein
MRKPSLVGLTILVFSLCGLAVAQQPAATPAAPKPAAPAKAPTKAPAAPKPDSAAAPAAPDPDAELQDAVTQAGDDPAALARNLQGYLVKYPDTPKATAIYHALVDAEMQLQNPKLALQYAEKVIAAQPGDIQTTYLAVSLLEKQPDEASQTQGVTYGTQLLDAVGKADPAARPPTMTIEDWQAGRDKFLMNVRVIRGRMERNLRKNDDATNDFNASFRLLPNADAAMNLGEIAEENKKPDEAIHQYAIAFMIVTPDDEGVNRDTLRAKIGTIWHQTHDSDAGLGDLLLSSYDKVKPASAAPSPAPAKP